MVTGAIRLISGAALAASIFIGTAAYAQWDEDMRYYGDRNGWVTIGQKAVNGQVDYDRIQVRGGDRFKKIRVCSLNRPFELRRLSAQFANGQRQEFDVGMIVPADSCTRGFDLLGRRRNIQSMNLTYSRVGWGVQRPRLIVQAK